MKRYFVILILSALSLISRAQNPVPAKPQSEPILIVGARAHIGNGRVIENSAIAFDNGKITAVGDAGSVDATNYKRVIDAHGKEVYPGFINCNSTTGLTEIDLVRSTADYNEVGDLNPNVRSIIAYNTDSKIPATIRCNGVLLEQIVPVGGTIAGQSSVVELDGWNWEDAAYKTDEGIHLNWPRM